MKTLTAILVGAFLLTMPAIWAQDAPKRERPGGPGGPAGNRMLGFFGLSGQMGEKLNLTDEQKKKAMEIAQQYRPQLEEIRKKMMENFRGILTDEQKKKVDEAMEQMRQRFQQGRGESGRPARDSGERKRGGDVDKK
jgi:Spy/CpxP family protein refolding chaperone